MEKQNILIIGLGSMGSRRARLMRHLGHPARLFGVDALPERRLRAEEEQGMDTFESLEQALASSHGFAAAFVCTAPLAHSAIAASLLEAGIHVFSELNLVADGYESLQHKARQKGLTLFLSSTMLYRRETQYITECVANFAKPVNYIYHIGQYLRDWHPWENYRDFFVGNPRTGGIREILAIELPWLATAFGPFVGAQAICRTLSNMELAYPDSCFCTLQHENGTLGQLAADLVSPKAVRHFELYGEELHLFWEGRPDSLYRYDTEKKENFPVDTYAGFLQDKRYSDNIVENAYIEEMENFFEVCAGRARPKWDFARDAEILTWIDRLGVDGQ